jgi:hypothetical protein
MIHLMLAKRFINMEGDETTLRPNVRKWNGKFDYMNVVAHKTIHSGLNDGCIVLIVLILSPLVLGNIVLLYSPI